MSTGSTVLQSGIITPGHLAAWTADGIIQDAGVTFYNTYGVFGSAILGVNFNSANTDNPIQIALPTGYTRYRIDAAILSGANASLTTATCGLFTSTGGAGATIVTGGTAITVSQTAIDTINNLQFFTLQNQNTIAYSDTVIYFRVVGAQGSPATGNITVNYKPLP